jgi:hypothetical protein
VGIHTFLGKKCHVLTSVVQIVVTYDANSSNSLLASACRAIPSLVASDCGAAPSLVASGCGAHPWLHLVVEQPHHWMHLSVKRNKGVRP